MINVFAILQEALRRVYLIFQESFGMPMYANIAEIINVIFGTEYTENHAMDQWGQSQSIFTIS